MSDPPNEPDHLERFLRSVDALRTDAIKRVRRLTSDPAAERAIRTIRDEILERAPRVIRAAQQASERFRRAFEDALPSNWKELEDDQVFAAVELMAGTGWSLLWTPGPAVVVAILVAEDANARRAALLEAEDEVLRDVDQMLAGIDTEELVGLRNALAEALEAHRQDLHKAAQALTTATLSSILHEHFLERSHAKIRKNHLLDEGDLLIEDFRWAAVQRAVAKALEEYDPVKGRPERSDFNRHASAHRVKEPQYRRVNSLSALMLVASVLKELDLIAKRQGGGGAPSVV